jgi:hypothetical protein
MRDTGDETYHPEDFKKTSGLVKTSTPGTMKPGPQRRSNHTNDDKSDWTKYKEAVEASIPTELSLPTSGYKIFNFLRRVIILREEPNLDPGSLDARLEDEWEEIPSTDKVAYDRVAQVRNQAYQLNSSFLISNYEFC